MTKIVYRPTRIKNGKRVKFRMYRLCYQLPGMPKKKFISLRTSDQQVAEREATEFLRELQQEEAGVIGPKRLRDAAKKPLLGHVEDFVADLLGAGRDAAYVYNTEKRLAKLCVECGWVFARDVTVDSFQTWRAKQIKAAKTLKEYLDAASGLMKWLEKTGRHSGNPLIHVSRLETKGRQTRLRRAFTFQEIVRLLGCAGARKVGYLAALFTGLRRDELRSLQWGDVQLDAEHPFITVRASTTKNHKSARIDIHRQLDAELRAIRPADADEATPVFSHQTLPSMWMMKRDLEAAGIPYKDAQGRQADFHALRGSLNTHMALAKVEPQTRQQIMRHSDIRLTLDVYTDKSMLPVAQAIHCLPSFEAGAAKGATLGATNLGVSGHLVSSRGTASDLDGQPEVPLNERLSHELAQSDAESRLQRNGCLARTRT